MNLPVKSAMHEDMRALSKEKDAISRGGSIFNFILFFSVVFTSRVEF